MVTNNDSELDVLDSSSYYKIEDPVPRQLWAAYFSFLFISSVIGDTTILLSSWLHKAIKLHTLMVTIIEFMAVCDLAVSLFTILPRITTLVANEWVFGGFTVCYYFCCIGYFLVPVGILNICIMLCFKLMVLKFPLKAMSWGRNRAVIACAAVIIYSACVPMFPVLYDKDDIFFDYKVYQCNFRFGSPVLHRFRTACSFLFLLAPGTFVIIATSWLLYIAHKTLRRRKETLKWQGVITAIVVATFFCISVLPYSIYHFNNSYFDKDPQSIYFRVADCCLYLHIISNFYIYALTISSFRQFLWYGARKICPWLETSSLESSRSQGDTMSVYLASGARDSNAHASAAISQT